MFSSELSLSRTKATFTLCVLERCLSFVIFPDLQIFIIASLSSATVSSIPFFLLSSRMISHNTWKGIPSVLNPNAAAIISASVVA